MTAPPTFGLQPHDLTAARLRDVRAASEALIEPLTPEDLCLQGMADASPPKWHLAHTTWFFDTFLLQPHLSDPPGTDTRWGYLFNSYYDAVGARHPRPQRGLLTRPAIVEVLAWRARVDEALERLLKQLTGTDAAPSWDHVAGLIELGLQHEQQHQELLLMDLLDGFSRQPLEPTYGPDPEQRYDAGRRSTPMRWVPHEEGLAEVGHGGGGAALSGFHFDNEAPRHRIWLSSFALADRLVSNREYATFIADDGYRRPELWMSEGWQMVNEARWRAPRYWRGSGPPHRWEWEFTLAGRRALHPDAPVRHLSWFEADAYARWAGARLPTEEEWEVGVARDAMTEGQTMTNRTLHQVDGVLWQWTASPYRPYPGYRTAPGAVGEYNGKFMSSQIALRGSSFLTPPGHARLTYRNFFAPASRWMAAGVRLARDIS